MKTRRSFFRLVGAAPIAAKVAAEEATKALTGLGSIGNGINPYGGGVPVGVQEAGPSVYPKSKDISKMLLDRAFRDLVQSAAYENNRHVSFIDHDLASKRSWSLAAKLTFQRQRNVAREIDGYAVERQTPWSLFVKRMNPFG